MLEIMSGMSWKSEASRRLIRLLPHREQLTTLYRQINGAAPDLRSPRLLSEKILHRVLFERDPLLRTFCDKIAAKEWIAARIGPDRTPRTLAVTDSVDALETLSLPDRWMLKASHGSGWYQMVDVDTHPLDASVLGQARKWLNSDYADTFQEWGYRKLTRRLLAEEFLSMAGEQSTEMSAFCFHGRAMGVRLYRAGSALSFHRGSLKQLPRTKECFLDETLQPLPLVRAPFDYFPELGDSDRQQLESFLQLAGELSSDTPFLRVDGYLSDQGVVVGELTPYPGAGIWLRMPRQWDAWFGAFWT